MASLRLAPWLLATTLLAGAAGCEDCSKGSGTGAADAPQGEPTEAAATGAREGGLLNVTPVPTASVEAMINPDKLPAYAGETGSIEGTISVTGDPAAVVVGDYSRCPDAEKIWGRAFREGSPSGESGARPLADAVIGVTGYKGFYVAEKQDAEEVRIENCGYTTRTATLTFGQRLEVKNLSKDFWTPVLEPGTNMVLMMATPHGDPAKIYPKKPGHYLLLDRDRKYAVVDVYAFLHPLHAVSAPSGYYRIDGVPVGKVKVSSTHPQIDSTAETEVEVKAGVVHKVDLALKNVNRDAGAPADAGSDGGRPRLR